MTHTFLYRRKVVTLDAVAEEVRSRQSFFVIMSQVPWLRASRTNQYSKHNVSSNNNA